MSKVLARLGCNNLHFGQKAAYSSFLACSSCDHAVLEVGFDGGFTSAEVAVGVGILVDVIDTRVGVEVGGILVSTGVGSGSLSTPQPATAIIKKSAKKRLKKKLFKIRLRIKNCRPPTQRAARCYLNMLNSN